MNKSILNGVIVLGKLFYMIIIFIEDEVIEIFRCKGRIKRKFLWSVNRLNNMLI